MRLTTRARDLWRSTPPLVFDGVLAVVAFTLAVGLISSGRFSAPDDEGRALDALGVVLAALTSLPLVARRRWPLAVLLVTGAGTAALYALDYPLGPPGGAVVAVYTVASLRDTVRLPRPLTGGIVLAMYGGLMATHFAFRDPGVEVLLGAIVWGGAWVAGDRSRLRREQIVELEERARRAEHEAERDRRLAAAEERARIARELHDSAGHAINVILVQAGAARLLLDRDPDRSKVTLETLEEVARETIGEIDELVRALREEDRETDALAPLPSLGDLETLAERHRSAGLAISVAVRGEPRSLPRGVDLAAYRIVQEALTNAVRHGEGQAEVDVSFGDAELDVSVTNPVAGNGAPVRDSGGHGLVGMHERAALVGGSLVADRSNGAFRVRARLPYGREGS